MKKYLLCLWLITAILGLQAQTVYITKTGAKYHTGSCRYLSHSKIAIDLAAALDRGYEACKICRPGQTAGGTDAEQKKEDREIDTSTKNTGSSQCTGITQKGSRCKRMTRSANGKCYQHGG